MELQEYYANTEWDLMEVIGRRNSVKYPCCPENFLDVTFNVTIRRKTLFYTVNLMIPVVAINMLTYLAFYLPSDCGEKISLCITILLSLSMFQLLLLDIMPPTSIKIPLLGKYILFTTVVVSLSVLCSVVVLSVHFRSGATHEMPRVTRKLFLTLLPRLLFMQRPEQAITRKRGNSAAEFESAHCDLSNYANPYKRKFRPLQMPSLDSQDSSHTQEFDIRSTFSTGFDTLPSNYCEACAQQRNKRLPANAEKALDGVLFIAKHLKDDDRANRVSHADDRDNRVSQ